MAIGINVKKISKESNPCVSKFFGDPTVPNAWVDNWSDDVLFFCQIKLEEIAELDKDNCLPHSGYLYVFLDTEFYPYTPMVYYCNGEPDTVIDDFNSWEPSFSELTQGWEMAFTEVDDDAEGIKLFGAPANLCCEEEAHKLFMQYDPLVECIGFLSNIDGFAYFFFEDDEKNLDNIFLRIEQS